MSTTIAAIAVAGAAVVGIYIFRQRQQQQAIAMQQQQAKKSSEPYALSLWDQFTVGASIVAGIYGGPAAGGKVAGVLAS